MTQTSEAAIAKAVMRIAAKSPDGTATFENLWKDLPNEIALTAEDQRPSVTRPGEEMWQQIVRNIKSHDVTEGNAIEEGWLVHVPKVGYRITAAGKKHVS